MPSNNPYIKLVQEDRDIFDIPHNATKYRWQWSTSYFCNTHPLILEIGTGMGNFFSSQVWKHPQKNFIGMEVRYKRCYQTAEKSRKMQIHSSPWEKNTSEKKPNFCIIKEFAQKIPEIFAPQELSETYIFFPDPWANKARQKKHRLLQATFLKELHTLTKKWWKLFYKTDHREYFESTVSIIEEQQLWHIVQKIFCYETSSHFNVEHITEFEGLYRGEQTSIHYLELVKI